MPVCSLDPEAEINKRLEGSISGQSLYFSLQFEFEQYYLDGKPSITLQALVEIVDQEFKRVAVGVARDASVEIEGVEGFEALAAKYGWPIIECDQPIALDPIAIAKPWGQEIWYTGIEKRGQSRVGDGIHLAPLPWLLAVAPQFFAAKMHQSLSLLKILDPLPEPVFGDLYFELHEEKQEVYVVTHIDERAWPTGEGRIKIGFDQSERRKRCSDQTFVDAFNEAVQSYEAVRRSIDAKLDECRLKEGIALNEPVFASKTKAWLETVDEELTARELALRQQMDSLKGEVSLRVGDVLKVPCFTPHSLMHGVRTIEFQTPVYERQILSFAQKVLTQDHWDTAGASKKMSLEEFSLEAFEKAAIAVGVSKEVIVNFSDFQVDRITLQPDSEVDFDSGAGYLLAIGVQGGTEIGNQLLEAEKAVLIPAACGKITVKNTSSTVGVFLLSTPR